MTFNDAKRMHFYCMVLCRLLDKGAWDKAWVYLWERIAYEERQQ